MTARQEFHTSFSFATTPLPYERVSPSGIAIHIESDCVGQSANLASDLITALEYGAYPALQAVLIDRMNNAQQEGKPLVCVLDFVG